VVFVDRIRVFVQAGNGGRGAVSFRREKFVPKGGPDGGDGGRGGDVILRADSQVDNLSALFYEPLIKAKNGAHGMGKKMFGRAAGDKVVKVPVGTIVWLAEDKENVQVSASKRPSTEEEAADGAKAARSVDKQADDVSAVSDRRNQNSGGQRPPLQPIVDLARDGQEFVLCEGGAGGKGNVHFKSSRNRAPRQYTEGEEGERGHFLFELRTIADAGLVGYPNAGKSTLLRTISAARPKVAPYPFTTLHPIVGVVEFPGYVRASVADIPGLIEGAHRNVGLGHDFLRHITRCRVLIFVVDVAGSEGRDPVQDLEQLRKEIDLYDAMLSARPWFVVANKMDLPSAQENLAVLRRRFSKIEIVPVSAAKGEGIDELKQKLGEML
jgi:GTP-binding protein